MSNVFQMSSRYTPNSKQKTEKELNESDILDDYLKKSFTLMSSCYYPQNEDIFQNLYSRTATGRSIPEKKVSFPSSLADLKLKRFTESRISSLAAQKEQFEQKVEMTSRAIRENSVDLNNVFSLETKKTMKKPLYLVNAENDQMIAQKQKDFRNKPLDMLKIEKEYTQRLEKSAKKGKERMLLRKQKEEGNQTLKPSYERKGQPEPALSEKISEMNAVATMKYQRQISYGKEIRETERTKVPKSPRYFSKDDDE